MSEGMCPAHLVPRMEDQPGPPTWVYTVAAIFELMRFDMVIHDIVANHLKEKQTK